MKISILTLFPEMFLGPFDHSIIKRAVDKKLIEIKFINIRDFGIGRHKIVDDKPYGGGAGMLMRADVIDNAIKHASCSKKKSCKERIILLDPQGKKFKQEIAVKLANFDHLIIICTHYEGVDERVKTLIDEEISIGDYILTGGEIPAMVLTDAIVRLLPKVLGKEISILNESFEKHQIEGKTVTLLEYPQYTHPKVYRGMEVPEILLSGDHKKIVKWREEEALKKTLKRRPDLLD